MNEQMLIEKSSKIFIRNLVIGGACASNPCQNGGTCVNGAWEGDYRCNCTQGYTGQQCESEIFSLPADKQQNLTFSSHKSKTLIISGPSGSRIRFDFSAMPPEICYNNYLYVDLAYPNCCWSESFTCLSSPVTTYSRSNMANIQWSSTRQSFMSNDSTTNYAVTVQARESDLFLKKRI